MTDFAALQARRAEGEPPAATGLRARLTLIVALALIPFVAMMVLQANLAYQRLRDEGARNVANAASAASDEHRRLIRGAALVLNVLKGFAPVKAGGPECDAVLRQAFAQSTGYANFARFDADGRLLCSAVPPPGGAVDEAGAAWFQRVRETRGFVLSRPVVSPITQTLVLRAAEPLLTEGGEFAGALAISIPIQNLGGPLVEAEAPPGSVMWIVDGDGQPMMQSGAPLAFADEIAAGIAAGRRTVEAQDGSGRYILGLAPLAEIDVVAVLAAPRESAAPIGGPDLAIQVILPLLMLFVVAYIVWFAADRLVLRWSGMLRTALRDFGAGRHPPPPPDLARAPAEFQDLYGLLARMVGRIDAREAEMRATLAQREVLLKEIHHRVKNNLQIVSSLLSLQANAHGEGEVRNALETARSRIAALATVHRRLYEKDDLMSVDAGVFVEDLSALVGEAFSRERQRISVRTEADHFSLPADTATPLGLFVVEALTNAYRHAFPEGRKGDILVSLRKGAERTVAVTVRDNGAGAESAARREGAMGQTLLAAFARQLRGTIEQDSKPGQGTAITLRFPLP